MVPCVYSFVHPVLKVFAYQSVDDVDQPLPWKPVLVSGVRQVVPHVWPLLGLFQHAFYTQRFVLRNEHHFDVAALDVLLLSGDEVLAEILDIRSAKSGCTYNGYGVVAAEERLALDGKELELLLLAFVFGAPLGCWNAYWPVGFNLYHRLFITVITES